MSDLRPAAVAGTFYPGDPEVLRQNLGELLASVPSDAVAASDAPPKALIAPHAGYVYSGSTAALAYAQWAPWRTSIRRVILLGPTHRVAVDGLALPASTAFATALGRVPVDREALAQIASLPGIQADRDDVHAQEHSLEVHLPFLQQALGNNFLLVPLAVGRCPPERVSAVLEHFRDDPASVILVSSDLSHFHRYESATELDRATCRTILNRQYLTQSAQACGAFAVNGLTLTASRHGLRPRLLGYCNSGDTAGDRDRVVGYASFAYEDAGTDALGEALLTLARDTLNRHFAIPAPPPLGSAEHLTRLGASFVTLTRNGRLRGCIGSLQAYRPLGSDIRENALAAALRDPRFPALTAEELPLTRIEVSLLSPAEPLHFADETGLLAQLRPGQDGLIFRAAGRQSTFLPQVWEQLPSPEDFLAHLRQKAGLPADYWSDSVEVARYTVDKWKEPEPLQ